MTRRRPVRVLSASLVCPACSRRVDGVVQLTCPVCAGAGTLVMGVQALLRYPPEVVALAATMHLENTASMAMTRRYGQVPTPPKPPVGPRVWPLMVPRPPAPAWLAQRAALTAAVEKLRDAGVLGDPLPGFAAPVPVEPEAGDLAVAELHPGLLAGGTRLAAICATRLVDGEPADPLRDVPQVESQGGHLGVREVAQAAGLRPEQVRQLQHDGRLPPPDVRLGSRGLWRPETIEAWRATLPAPRGKNTQRLTAEARRRRRR